MEIKIGSRWQSIYRPSVKLKVYKLVYNEEVGDHVVYCEDWKTTYTKQYFLGNFEPREEQTVREFKVGDKVKIEFEGVVKKISEHPIDGKIPYVVNFWHGEMKCLLEHLTLIEPAKPELAVGQVWESRDGLKYTVRIIENGRVCFWSHGNKWFNDAEVNDFIVNHKLLDTP